MILERSMDDRTHHFMPSSPSIFAWRRSEYSETRRSRAYYHVPLSFSCPDDRAVGRWIWKTSNSCNDVNNVGRSTTTFLREEYEAVVGGKILQTCTTGVEHFISCVDFKFTGPIAPTPAPPPPQCCTGQGGQCTAPCSSGGWCGASESNCLACAGSWCGGSSPTPPAPTPVNPSP